MSRAKDVASIARALRELLDDWTRTADAMAQGSLFPERQLNAMQQAYMDGAQQSLRTVIRQLQEVVQ